MQYVGSPQTSFRFGSSVTRSVSVSSLVSIGEGTSEGGAPGSSVGGDAAGSLLSGGVPGAPAAFPRPRRPRLRLLVPEPHTHRGRRRRGGVGDPPGRRLGRGVPRRSS